MSISFLASIQTPTVFPFFKLSLWHSQSWLYSLLQVFRRRYSLDQGIEDPNERSTKGKPEKDFLEVIYNEKRGDFLKLIIKDDRKGVNVNKLCEKVNSGGFWKGEDIEKLSQEEKLNLIFLPSFSTKEDVSETSGRGVGMDMVKLVWKALVVN